jgi:uncharacterized membrane protein YjjP (DUF1212 family)
MKRIFQVLMLVAALCLGLVGSAFAEFTVPTLPVTNMETAGAAVAGLVAGYVLIKIVIRMIKGA